MTMLRDYSYIIAQDVDEDIDGLEPVDPSVFFGVDEDEDIDDDDGDLFEDDEDVPDLEEEEEY